jgi:2-phosphosulfolactate phosphatase
MPERPPVYAHLLPSLMPPGCLAGSTAVVIDVLRATTVMIQALASGCAGIIPCLEIEEAREVACGFAPGSVLLGGERGGRPIPGFDLGNSPAEYSPEACRGKTVVITTTNGTRAIRACRAADRVYVAGFVNLAAMSRRLWRELEGPEQRPVHLVCAGTEGEVSWEDTLLAGSLCRAVSYFQERFTPAGNDAARLALEAAPRSFTHLGRLLRLGRGGRNVESIGLAADIDDAARVDRFSIVARWQPTPEPGRIESDD